MEDVYLFVKQEENDMNILPKPQKMEISEGTLKSKALNIRKNGKDERIDKA